jgi:hypothetical protein
MKTACISGDIWRAPALKAARAFQLAAPSWRTSDLDEVQLLNAGTHRSRECITFLTHTEAGAACRQVVE